MGDGAYRRGENQALGTFIIREWRFRIKIRKKRHYAWLLSWYFLSSYNYGYDVLFLLIRRNSLLLYLRSYIITSDFVLLSKIYLTLN